MTKRDFFRVLIKILVLYSFIISVFSLLPMYIGYAFSETDLWIVLLSVGSIFLLFGILVAFIYGTDKIIQWFRLDKGYDEDRIDLGNISEVSILKMGIIIIAGLLFIDHFPIVMRQGYLAFKERVSDHGLNGTMLDLFGESPQYFQLILSSISLVIAYLLMTNYANLAERLWKVNQRNK